LLKYSYLLSKLIVWNIHTLNTLFIHWIRCGCFVTYQCAGSRPQRSLHTLSSVVFFDLNAVWFSTCRYKLKNIEETEAAKKQLQDKRPFVGRGRSQSSSIPSSYSADYFQRGREYAEKLRGGMLVWLRIRCEIFWRMMCVVSDISFADLEVIWSLMPLGWDHVQAWAIWWPGLMGGGFRIVDDFCMVPTTEW
jgi:hypothetical protein